LELANPSMKDWSDGVTLSHVKKNLLHAVDDVNLPRLTLVKCPDIRFFNILVDQEIGMFTCKGLIKTRPNDPTNNSKVLHFFSYDAERKIVYDRGHDCFC